MSSTAGASNGLQATQFVTKSHSPSHSHRQETSHSDDRLHDTVQPLDRRQNRQKHDNIAREVISMESSVSDSEWELSLERFMLSLTAASGALLAPSLIT